MTAKVKWQQEYLDELQTAPNHILLAMYIEANIPDDYDGGYTEMASWKMQEAIKAFYARLVSTGWITQEELKTSGAEDWYF
jgi:hypothetical protein